MKFRLVLLLLVTVLLMPQVTFAAWWNPFSWFGNSLVEQPVVRISDVVTTHESEDVQEEELDTPEIEQVTREEISPKVETTEPEKKIAPVVINQVVDNTEIDDLKTEIQSLKRSLASIQSQTTNTPVGPNSESSHDAVIYEQILDKLNTLEQKVENLENQVKDNNYSKLLARVEALEDSTSPKTEDQSVVIKTIIDRVNLLTNNAGVLDSKDQTGDEFWVPLVCDPGSPIGAKGGTYYGNKLYCKDLTDLKH